MGNDDREDGTMRRAITLHSAAVSAISSKEFNAITQAAAILEIIGT